MWRYLTVSADGRDRVLADDFLNINDTAAWWKEMDDTREAHEHNKPTKNGKPRSYSHYVIAPDPKDFEGLTREEGLHRVRQVATGWAREYLGDYQVAIVYHDDGSNGNIHAHIVANVSNLATGLKRHESADDWKLACKIVDRLSTEAGMTPLSARLEREDAEIQRYLDELNEARTSRGERAVPRDTRRPESTMQESVLSQAERAMRLRARTSWKDEVRIAANEAAELADSFDTFRRLMRNAGFDVYQNKRGNLVYTHSDGEHKFRDVKLGKMYQADFLATQFMDLRFTKAAWSSRKRDYTRLEDSDIRVPKVDVKHIDKALQAWHRSSVTDMAQAADVIARMRANVESLVSQAERYERLVNAIDHDMADRRIVDAGAPLIEGWRKNGRISDSCPQPKESIKAYEAARKRLYRRDYGTDMDSLTSLRQTYQRHVDDLSSRVEETTHTAQDLIAATATLKRVDEFLEAGSKYEEQRYGNRIERAFSAIISGGAARRNRGTMVVGVAAVRRQEPKFHKVHISRTPRNVLNTGWYRRRLDAAMMLQPPPLRPGEVVLDLSTPLPKMPRHESVVVEGVSFDIEVAATPREARERRLAAEKDAAERKAAEEAANGPEQAAAVVGHDDAAAKEIRGAERAAEELQRRQQEQQRKQEGQEER